ncbi:hypothetical protein RB595_005850 [Gaeumannomyces hyphopodioides]
MLAPAIKRTWRPWRPASLVFVGVVTYANTWRQGQWSTSAFLTTFSSAWLVLFAVWSVWTNQLYPKLFSPLRHLPGPKDNSFWNGQQARISKEPTGAPMVDWFNSIPNDGLIRYLSILNLERLAPTSAKALQEILVTKNYDFEKPEDFRHTIGRILGVGILLAEGDEHKAQRRALNPAFGFRHIKDLVPVFWSKSVESVLAMTAQVDADVQPDAPGPRTARLEASGWASRATLDIIGVAGLGRDFGAIANPDTELTRTYNHLFKPSRQAQLLGVLGLIIGGWAVSMLPISRNNDIQASSGIIRATCRDLIREKQAKLNERKKGEAGNATGGAAGPRDVDILSVALESGGFSEENLVDQLMTFLAAGHETTASAMTWAVYLLSVHPGVQSRLRAEVRARLPAPGSDGAASVTSIDIDRMPYLNAVCLEILRYFAPAPNTLRVSNKDTTVQGQFVPKGTRVMLVISALNRSTALWGPDAGSFNPDRWLDPVPGSGGEAYTVNNNGGASSNYALMTFLHGPRSCIGSAFARAEFACLLAAWIGRFEFSLQEEEEMDEKNVDIKGGITQRPAKGMRVWARVMEGW